MSSGSGFARPDTDPVAFYCSVGGRVGFAEALRVCGGGGPPGQGTRPRVAHPIGPTFSSAALPRKSTPIGRATRGCSPPLTDHPAPTPPTCISRTCRCRERGTVMDHVKIEIGLGRFEAFTIIGPQHDSSVHDSVAGALVWLSGQFIASGMSTEVEVQ